MSGGAMIFDGTTWHRFVGGGGGGEPALGNPTVDGHVLSSTIAGARSWVEQSGGGGAATDGWNTISDTLTYASATTFTVPTDLTTTYQKGTKLKLTNVIDKYFYVISSAYGAPNTTVTVTGGDDYALASAAITAPYYSYVENPQGFPDWFNYTPTITGLATTVISSVVIGTSIFSIKARTVFYKITATFTIGTANSQSIMVTLPVSANSSSNTTGGSASRVISADLIGGVVIMVSSSGWIQVRGYDATAWITGSNKQLRADVFYQMG